MIIWLTGLSGSGKTTVNKILQQLLIKKIDTIMIDGDVVRELYGNDLTYESDRIKQIKRIQNLAKIFDKSKRIVLVSALYSNQSLLKNNRKNFKNILKFI